MFSDKLLGMMYSGWCLDHTGSGKIKFKDGLNSQKWSTAREKLL